MNHSHARGRSVLGIPLLILLVAFAYAPSLLNGWVWDDHALIENEPAVNGSRPWTELWTQPVRHGALALPFSRPLPMTVHAVLRAVAGPNPALFHLASLLAHAAVAALFFLLLIRCGAPSWAAWWASALYAVHPFHTAAVSYAAGFADPLAAVFSLLALLAWHSAADAFASSPHGSGWQKSLALGLASWLGAMLCKEWAALVPVAGLCLLAGRAGARFWIFSAVGAVFVLAMERCYRSEIFAGAQLLASPDRPLGERWISAIAALGFYVAGGVFPWVLRMDRVESPADPAFWGWFAAAILILFWVVRERRRRAAWLREPGVTRGVLWFLSFWIVHSQILVSLNAPMAEHWMYFAYLGLAYAGAMLAARFHSRVTPQSRRVALILAMGALAFWTTRTFLRQFDWRDDETFFTANLKAGANAGRSYFSLAEVLANRGEYSRAATLFETGLSRDPRSDRARYDLARCYELMGERGRARAWVDELLSEKPGDADLIAFRKRLSTGAGSATPVSPRKAPGTKPPGPARKKSKA
ncbi:MAG: tetratricopeptide repeat protein [Verrucomicrobiae bacterium]|nr:tetratricopeptide repeat protein [Verrucomicrobiae bacterium]